MLRTLAIILLIIAAAPSVLADMYRYQDESGSVCMTNNLDSVPRKFRKGMTIVRDEAPGQSKLLPSAGKQQETKQLEDVAPLSTPTPVSPGTNRERFIRTGLVVVAVVILCFVISRIAAAVSLQKIGTLLVLLLLLVGGVYLYGLYIQELRTVFDKLRGNALNIKKNVETRENKTDDLLKKIGE